MGLVTDLEARYPELVELAVEYRHWRFHVTLLWLCTGDGGYGDLFGERIGVEAHAAEAESCIRDFLARQAEPVAAVDAYLKLLRRAAKEEAMTSRARNAARQRLIGHQHLLRYLKAKDSTGRQAYYVVLLRKDCAEAFDGRMHQSDPLDLEAYGWVLGRCYGSQPTPELHRQLLDNGFEERELP